MTWETLLTILKQMDDFPESKKLLKQPILIANEDKKRFLGIGGFEVIRSLGNVPVLNVTKQK